MVCDLVVQSIIV